MNEHTLYIIQTDILGQRIYSHGEDVPFDVVMKITHAISERPQLINMVFHDRKSGNFYKAVYSI